MKSASEQFARAFAHLRQKWGEPQLAVAWAEYCRHGGAPAAIEEDFLRLECLIETLRDEYPDEEFDVPLREAVDRYVLQTSVPPAADQEITVAIREAAGSLRNCTVMFVGRDGADAWAERMPLLATITPWEALYGR